MTASIYDKSLLIRINTLKMMAGFGDSNGTEYVKAIHLHFSDREIIELKNMRAIPQDYVKPVR